MYAMEGASRRWSIIKLRTPQTAKVTDQMWHLFYTAIVWYTTGVTYLPLSNLLTDQVVTFPLCTCDS